MDPLDNPIWSALTTRQARLARCGDGASVFHPDVSILGGVENEAPACFAALAGLLAHDETVGLFLREAPAAPQLRIESAVPVLQMVRREGGALVAREVDAAIEPLGADDVRDMLSLTARTKPGPFNVRTREMGDYFGVRRDGALVAMAGERLRVEGHTEVSAICTDEGHLGRGYAAALLAFLVGRIVGRGERAFLHVLPTNTRAIALYERLGFAPGRLKLYVRAQRR